MTKKEKLLSSALSRLLGSVIIGARLGEGPLIDGEFFTYGFPQEEQEILRSILSKDEWNLIISIPRK